MIGVLILLLLAFLSLFIFPSAFGWLLAVTFGTAYVWFIGGDYVSLKK